MIFILINTDFLYSEENDLVCNVNNHIANDTIKIHISITNKSNQDIFILLSPWTFQFTFITDTLDSNRETYRPTVFNNLIITPYFDSKYLSMKRKDSTVFFQNLPKVIRIKNKGKHLIKINYFGDKFIKILSWIKHYEPFFRIVTNLHYCFSKSLNGSEEEIEQLIEMALINDRETTLNVKANINIDETTTYTSFFHKSSKKRISQKNAFRLLQYFENEIWVDDDLNY